MSERRYCRDCKEETLHDKKKTIANIHQNNQPLHTLMRVFGGLATLGLTETPIFSEKIFVCQKCQKETKR